MLALGSANQLKVSRPMSSASWEHTAAKLHQPHKELKFRSISFSADGSMLAVLAGTEEVVGGIQAYFRAKQESPAPGPAENRGRPCAAAQPSSVSAASRRRVRRLNREDRLLYAEASLLFRRRLQAYGIAPDVRCR
mgnify:CR=1 FL=1